MTVILIKDRKKDIKGYKCLIGKSKLKLFIKIGGKYGEKDCQIFWDTEENRFWDKVLFKCILDNMHEESDALKFVRLFNNFEYISFDSNKINTNIDICNPSCIQKIINYVNNSQINDKLKRCLASMILRCYVDNNAFKPPLNGCIRHYIQVLLLLGYKFNIGIWKMEKLNSIITPNIAQDSEKLSKVISDIGYPNNSYNIGTDDFRDKYRKLYNNKLISDG